MSLGKQAVVGAFVLGGVILALAAVLLFGNLDLFNPTVRAVVVFQDSIAGLSVGAPVTFRGVRVGSVDDIAIHFDPKTNVAYIPVTIRLEPHQARTQHTADDYQLDLPDLIKRGLRAELNLQSFVTGTSEIDLDFAPGTPAHFHPGISNLPEIPTQQSTIQRATEQLSQLPWHELADNANATMKSLSALTEQLNHDLPPLVQSVKTASDQSQQTIAAATQAIQAVQAHMDTTLEAIGQLAVSGNQQINQRGAELRTLLLATDQTMRQAQGLIDNLKTLTSSRSDARLNLESTLRDLSAATASLRGFAGEIERNPQLLLTGRQP